MVKASSMLSTYYDKKDYVFIFDKHQKTFYLSKGLHIVDASVNNDTGKIFWIFKKEDTNPYYGEWLTICKNRHNDLANG